MYNEPKICDVFVFPSSSFVLSPIASFQWPLLLVKLSSWKVCLNFLILLILTCYNLITEKDFLCGLPIKSLSSWNKPEILSNNRVGIHFKLFRIYTGTAEHFL